MYTSKHGEGEKRIRIKSVNAKVDGFDQVTNTIHTVVSEIGWKNKMSQISCTSHLTRETLSLVDARKL